MSDDGFLLGAITAIRGWRVEEDRTSPHFGLLSALFRKSFWTEGENIADCVSMEPLGMYRPVLSPCPGICEDHHGCGFYGYHKSAYVNAMLGAPVWGVVSMYGRVEVGTNGVRSSKAKILALHARSTLAGPAVALRYPTVPMFVSDEFMLKAFPLSDVTELL